MSVASIEALYRHESNRLIRFFARRTRHEAEAQDLMHDAFLHLSRASIEGDPLPYLCEFQLKPARDSDAKSATIPG